MLQRRRKRAFASLGVVCGIVFLAVLHAQVGLGDVGSGAVVFFAEPQPEIRSPGDE